MIAILKDRCLFWLHPLPLSSITHTKQPRSSARWPHYCRREKAHSISARCNSYLALPEAIKWFSARTTRHLVFPVSRATTHDVNQLFVSAFQSFCMSRHCNFPINSVFFLCLIPSVGEEALPASIRALCPKKRRLNILRIREKMHPATDESATYAFGRFVTIRTQPRASLLRTKWMAFYKPVVLVI